MRRTILMIAVAGLVAAACGNDAEPAPSDDGVSPSVVTTTTAAPAPSVVPETTTTTTGAETTTSAAESTTTTTPEVITTTTAPPSGPLVLAAEPVADGFEQPVLVVAPPADPRLFVVDQPGRIWVVDDGMVLPFLDIKSLVTFNNEQGLLGLAFHPDYASNGLFYVDYIDRDGNTRLVEYEVSSSDPNAADPDSSRELMRVEQPAANHNGGMLAFGPDGYLWFGLGDGGASDDRFGNGQRADTLLAAMLRIEVGPGAPEPYGIPPDNPYADGEDGAAEVWATGLRNPWRWSIDGNLVYIGDVGQNEIEEVSVASTNIGGLNYGWPIMEGRSCFQAENCNQSGLVIPVLDYRHSDGCSVTGGFVYRGTDLPELDGHYLYGDYCKGWVRSFKLANDGGASAETEWMPAGTFNGLTSFGVDSAGELYVATQAGTVYKLVRG
jgi:glucose/arabinose dehydrogenase